MTTKAKARLTKEEAVKLLDNFIADEQQQVDSIIEKMKVNGIDFYNCSCYGCWLSKDYGRADGKIIALRFFKDIILNYL